MNILASAILTMLALLLPMSAIAEGTQAADGEILPYPGRHSGSTAGPTIAQSVYAPNKQVSHVPANAPNVLIIMLDDVGPAIPDTYGGPVHMPTLSRIAETGISFNRFHNTSICSPTRAALLTGRNHHRVGFGQIAELANDWDGYVGRLPASTATVAKVLRENGYKTAAFGKWHNTPPEQATSQGPFNLWPTSQQIGFDYFYGFLAGESSQYKPAIVENTVRLPSPDKPDYHFSVDMTDKAIAWMQQERALAPDQPFLMYWAPGASHGPQQIFKEWADKYQGKFDQGWDVLREETYARQQALGWIPADAKLTPRAATMAGWDSIPADERPFQLRLMELFAGMTEHVDVQAGRLIDELDKLGIRDNTIVIYIVGDNGSSAEGQNGTISELLAQNGIATKIQDHIRALDELGGLDVLGGPKTANMYHVGWAWAGSTPYQGVKLNPSHLGGMRTPVAISWPKGIKHDNVVRSQFLHVNDIVPTLYDAIGITPPKVVDGVTQEPMDGVSFKNSFTDPKAPSLKHTQYFEVMGDRAIYHDGWIASVWGPRSPWVPGIPPGIATWSPENDSWQLYNLDNDFSQSTDLAAQYPEKLEAMKKLFDQEAKANKVYPVGGGLWSMIYSPMSAPQNPATSFDYTQAVVGVPEFAAPKVGVRSNLMLIDVEINPQSEGVLFALGGFDGGLSMWVDQGKLIYEYNLFEVERTRIEATEPLPTGKVKIELETHIAQSRGAAEVTLRVNGKQVAKGTVPRTAAFAFTANDAFDVGMDSYSPVSLAYFDRAPFKYNGTIERMRIDYLK